MAAMAPRTFLVDGSALAYRSFFAAGPGPAYAYASSLLALIEKESPDFALVAMDTPKKTFRHETYSDYKATRQKTPPELIKQLPTFERLAHALGFEVFGLDGWEADDVIGTLAVRAAEAGHEVYIVTGDKDFMQVISDRVFMYNPTRPGADIVIQDAEAVREKFHCRPDQVTDVLALMGDSSDNVPGVPRVGEKTALALIDQYQGLDDIYAKIDTIKPPGLQARLREGKDLAYLSKDLVTIRLDAPVGFELEHLAYHGPDTQAARELFVELDFPSLIDRLGGKATSADDRDYHVVTTAADYDAFLVELRAAHAAKTPIVFDTETTGLLPLESELVGLGFAFGGNSGWYLPVNLAEPIFGPSGHAITARERLVLLSASGVPAGGVPTTGVRTRGVPTASGALFDTSPADAGPTDDALLLTGTGVAGDPFVPPAGSDLERFLADTGPVLSDPQVPLVGQNLKYDAQIMSRYGVAFGNIAFDTMLASFVLDAHQAQHGLDFLALKHLGISKIPTSALIGKGTKQISMWDVPVETCGEYGCEDVDVTGRLHRLFADMLDGDGVEHVFRQIEMPVLPIIASMERHGILVDVDYLSGLSTEMEGRLEELTTEIHDIAGEAFNISSPKQLQAVLFEKLAIHTQLGIKRIKKTKSGYSTDASVLELLSEHPLPAKILEHRQLIKLKGTYVDALPSQVHPFTGRIHTTYHQGGASTGRLSSSDPNLQNIPIRTEEGRRIRQAFIAQDGYRLVSADYSQVELRVMAHLSGDEAMVTAFREGVDIHQRTASLVFGVGDEEVGPEIRARAKAINFGILYGMGAQRLARETGMTTKEATEFIEQYFFTFPSVKDWLDGTRDLAREQGWVETLTGRRRKIENIDSAEPRLRAMAANVAVNTPIQGSAADLIKLAMIAVDRALREEAPDARMLLQVHDELVFEVPEADVERVTALVTREMQGALELDVPLVVDTGSGHDWLEAH